MKRHQKLSLPELELTSGFSEVVIHTIFDVLVNIVDENEITLSRIVNMDETSHTVVLRPEKFIPRKYNIC
jgi:hypothetical protein